MPKEAQQQTEVHTIEVGVKLYLNGFPKSGLHALNLMAACTAHPALEKNWLGNTALNSWGEELVGQDRLYKLLEQLQQGHFIKGHLQHNKQIEDKLDELGYSMVFLYRDLRDVAVSQAHHVLHEDDERFVHPGKKIYRSMDSFEDVLIAVIEGVEQFPGIFDRWKLFEPWVDVPWVCKMSYELMISDTEKEADRFCRYLYHRTAAAHGFNVQLNDADIERQVKAIMEAIKRTELSPTYRKGIIGGYKKYFTNRVQRVFDDHAGDWYERMRY